LTSKSNWLGSTGNKPQSGDVDIAYSSEHFFKNKQADVEGWGIDRNEYTQLYEKSKKAARSATDDQIQLKSLIQLIVKKINESGNDLYASDKAANGGTIHFSYPQYSGDKKLDLNAQLDLDTVGCILFNSTSSVSYSVPVNTLPPSVITFFKISIKEIIPIFWYKY